MACWLSTDTDLFGCQTRQCRHCGDEIVDAGW